MALPMIGVRRASRRGSDRILEMTKDQVKSVLARVSTWPQERQAELAELALEIEAEFAGKPYRATADELRAIDEGLAGNAATDEEIEDAFASFRRA